MKFTKPVKGIPYMVSTMALVSTLTVPQAFAGTMGSQVLPSTGGVYAGFFGGWGESNRIKMSQLGTAFFTVADGGPLAVNIFGKLNKERVDFLGGHVGYRWADLAFGSLPFFSAIAPAAELEGYYIEKTTYHGEVNNDTYRLPEHHFLVSYPMKGGVFLTNAIANFNLTQFSRLHPFIGGGIGGGILSISHADALQIAPLEPGVNHFNSNPSDTQSTFAAQAKAGLNFDISQRFNIFAEYRWLYLSSSSYNFGSTVYPGHAPTSPWLVKLDKQNYNLGSIGIQYTI